MEFKNAQDMYQYCLKNGYIVKPKKWTLNTFSLIEKSLLKDEKVLLVFPGLTFSGKILESFASVSRYCNYALTNKRIIIADKTIFIDGIQTVPLKNINDITLSDTLMTIDTFKDKIVFGFPKKAMAITINKKIHEILDSLAKIAENNNSNISCADEILKFKQLLDQGIITQEEFDKKKQELLK